MHLLNIIIRINWLHVLFWMCISRNPYMFLPRVRYIFHFTFVCVLLLLLIFIIFVNFIPKFRWESKENGICFFLYSMWYDNLKLFMPLEYVYRPDVKPYLLYWNISLLEWVTKYDGCDIPPEKTYNPLCHLHILFR